MREKANVKRTFISILLMIVMLFGTAMFSACFLLGGGTLDKLQTETGIVVDGGAFEEGSVLVSNVINVASEEGKSVLEAIAEQKYDKEGEVYVFDIFVSNDGVKVQPDGKVKVTIPAPNPEIAEYVVFHVKDNLSVENLTVTYEDGKITFETSSFSYFVVAEAQPEVAEHLLSLRVEGNGAILYAAERITSSADLRLAEGEAVTLKAEAAKEDNVVFLGWFDGGSEALLSTEIEYTYTCGPESKDVCAKFGKGVWVKATIEEGTGELVCSTQNVTVDGDLYCVLVMLGEEIELSVQPAEGYAFIGWYERHAGDVGSDYFAPSSTESTYVLRYYEWNQESDRILEAKTARPHTFTAVVEDGNGANPEVGDILCGNETYDVFTGDYQLRDDIELTAVPANGYKFVYWKWTENDTDVTSDSLEYALRMPDKAVQVSAVFAKAETYALYAEGAGNIHVGFDHVRTEGSPYYVETDVLKGELMIAYPDEGYTFAGYYSGAGKTGVKLESEETEAGGHVYVTSQNPEITTIYAVFEAPVETSFLIEAYTGAWGTVYCNGVAYPDGYSAKVEAGTELTFKAVPNEGYEFVRWETVENLPQLISPNAEYTLTVVGFQQLYARFQPAVTELILSNLTESNFAVDVTGAPAVTEYALGSESEPNPYTVVVTGVTNEENRTLTNGVDYTIDLGGYSFEESQLDTYTITYTYIKNPEVKATLTVEVVAAKHVLTVGQQGAGGSVTINEEAYVLPAVMDLSEGASVTLVATPRSEDYAFLGWFEVDGAESTTLVLKDTPVCAEETYIFSMPANDYIVYAVFEAKVTALRLDGANAGFVDGKATYTIGDEYHPNPEQVVVYGVTAEEDLLLTKDEDYTIDLGGLDFETEGTYTITYTYNKNTEIQATLTVEVSLPTFTLYVTRYHGSTVYESFSQTYKQGKTAGWVAGTNVEGYDFIGWYTDEEEPQLITAEPEYAVVMTQDLSVQVRYVAKVTALDLDGLNAGFTDGKATYTIGNEYQPTPEQVIVNGVTVEGNVFLTKDEDYTIDLGGLDFEVEGTYTITYTYKKNTEIQATLTVEVVAPEYLFSATVGAGRGAIYSGEEELPNGYAAEHKEGESVTLKAVAAEGYEFAGWYTATDVPALISEEAEHTFVVEGETYVQAYFAAIVTALDLDGLNAGFTDGKATYTIGDEYQPNPEWVVVYGVTAMEETFLTKDEDYTIDLGGLDFETEGTYTITYTYNKNTEIKATLMVEVVAEAPGINLTYEGGAAPVEYNGGRAAYVFKESIKNNGVTCDIEDLGLSYEWRDSTSGEPVNVARDDTWDESLHYPSPAVVGTYDFVVYSKDEEGVKTDLLTVTREIIVNEFSLVTEASFSEYTDYTVIAVAEGRYYAMSNPFVGATEREAIEVFPDENGVISLGTNYEYVFRPYDTSKRTTAGDVCYGLRTGHGLYKTGQLILWGSSGRIEYTTSTSADNNVTIALNEDGSLRLHAPYCGGTLRLVYDEESQKYLFTALDENEDTRTSYPVYLYGEYIEPASQETYEFYGKLSKEYDGVAVSFNMYKEVYISTEEGGLDDYLKCETGRFVWTDLKGNVLIVGTPDEEGNVAGPSEVGTYRLVFQTLQKGESGMEWMEKAELHLFEIYESTPPTEIN